MAIIRLKPCRLSLIKALVCSLLVLLCLHTTKGMSGWGGCLDGQDVFATIRENSHTGELIAELISDTTGEGVRWSLNGKDADWFFLDRGKLRLNTSPEKVLDREAQGVVLMAELVCYEEDTLQSVYRLMVEILNENDHSPVFAENTVQSLIISELTPVNTVVFTVLATDEDNDQIIYSIDQTSPDAVYFKIEFPNSGEIMLSKPLDYETKTLLSITIHATEMSTDEQFNTSTNITITVLDGDDQYPQFLPCMLLFQDESNRVCTNPVYTVNVTEGEEDIVLDFSPGPIHAVDGDRGLSSPLSYAILSGDDDGLFLMDRETGEMRLTRGVKDRLTTPVLRLQVMAYQDDDPRKYTVATALVHVVAVNQFLPEFDMAEYHGFVIAGKSPATLVNTYGSKALMLRVLDQDFMHGFNPMIYFFFSPSSNHTDFYQITQEGLVIAKTNQLKAEQSHILEVTAIDQESGDVTFATVVVEVLPEGQTIPHSPLGDRVTGCTVGKALALSVFFMIILGCILYMMSWLMKRHKVQRGPLERGCVAQGKHPNVSLRWFQLMSNSSPMPQMDEVSFNNEKAGTYNPSFSLQEKSGTYVHKDLPLCRGPTPPSTTAAPDTSFIPTEAICSPVILNNVSPPIKMSASLISHPTILDVSPADMAKADAPPPENLGSQTQPHDAAQNPTEANEGPPQPHATPVPTEITGAPNITPLLQTAPSDPVNSTIDPSSPPSSLIAPCSDTHTASVETDTPPDPSYAHGEAASPLELPPYPKQTSTPPPTPEHAPSKVSLMHLDTSPLDTPPCTDAPCQVDQPSTSLSGQTDPSGHPEGAAGNTVSASQQRRPSSNSGNTQDSRREGEVDDDGFLGDEDKNSEDDDELEPDEEELLRVLARLHPTFISFSK
ncbi:cadherin-related family member 5-like [Myripristis murdjan]|uniref:cadherin-related family member 5-like n=1 Tax=Myripristis murdjan TaxID=586833 RepID=UPI0011761447|nr:cadherin-related family member 5-like [Myripristis murdjan]